MSYQNVKLIQQAVFNLLRSQTISSIGYNVNLQTAVAAIFVFVECPKSRASKVLEVLRPYQNTKSIRQAVFKISRSQAIFCIGYSVNLQTDVPAILVFVECSKSIAFEVLVVLRPYQNVNSIWQAVFKTSRSQAISCIGYNVNLQTAVAAILGFFRKMPQINSVRGLSGIKAISKCEVNLTSGFQDIAFTSNCERTDGQTDV